MFLALTYQVDLKTDNRNRETGLLPQVRDKQQTLYLAGPLGFEPRQSAPKALDLPLVDGPVFQELSCLMNLVGVHKHRQPSPKQRQLKIFFQYWGRVSVVVTAAGTPFFLSFPAAFTAKAREANNP